MATKLAGTYIPLINQTTAANTTVQWVNECDNGCYLQIDHGSITGAFTLLQKVGMTIASTTFNWCTVTEISLTNPTGTSANRGYNISDIRAPFLQLQYAQSAGTDFLKVAAYAKGN